MKKVTILLIGLVLLAASLTGCAKNGEVFTEKTYTAEVGQIAAVRIDVRDRQIEVTTAPDNQIRIDYFESDKEFYDISVSDNHVLTMTAASDKTWTDYIGGKAAASRKISLQIPDVLLEALQLSTTNEDILLPTLTVEGDISLSSVGGNIFFDKLNAGKTINLTAKNGDIAGSIIGSYDDYAISCDSKKGESNLPKSKENGGKTLTVANNNGDIDIEFVRE